MPCFRLLERQIKATEGLPDDKTILIEHFKDSSGNSQLMVHSLFGRKINAPLALLAVQAVRDRLGMEVGSVEEEDGILLYSYGSNVLPKGVLQMINPDTAVRQLEIMLPVTPVLTWRFGITADGRYDGSKRKRQAALVDAASQKRGAFRAGGA